MMDERNYYGEYGDEPELRASGLGIASFLLSIVSGLLFVAVFGWAVSKQVNDPGWFDRQNQKQMQNPDKPNPTFMLIGLGVLAAGGGELIALGLGIGGLCQKNRKKLFPILGVIFSAGPMLLFGFLVVLGLAMG